KAHTEIRRHGKTDIRPFESGRERAIVALFENDLSHPGQTGCQVGRELKPKTTVHLGAPVTGISGAFGGEYAPYEVRLSLIRVDHAQSSEAIERQLWRIQVLRPDNLGANQDTKCRG